MADNDLVTKIAQGETELLSAEVIIKRLSISRSTFNRWVAQSDPEKASDSKDAISFPLPDVRIGNSPRWTLETFKEWLQERVVYKNSDVTTHSLKDKINETVPLYVSVTEP